MSNSTTDVNGLVGLVGLIVDTMPDSSQVIVRATWPGDYWLNIEQAERLAYEILQAVSVLKVKNHV